MVYLAALAGSLGLHCVFSGWITWVAVLTVAAAPLVSVAISAVLGEADALGLFSLPEKKRMELDHGLRAYRPGDSPGGVHWKYAAKTGKLLVREERNMPLPKRRKRRAMVPVALCFLVVFCLFPPHRYDGLMQHLQLLLRRPGQVRLDLTVGHREESRQAVLDAVASDSQLLYLRGQVFEVYEGMFWQASAQNGWSVWEPVGEVAVEARANRNMVFAACDVTRQPSQRCLQLPQSTKAWAQTLVEGKSVAQIADYVRQMAKYDEAAAQMPENGDFVRNFAQNGQGYCIHFASAGVVLLRCAGIPARLVTGYVVRLQAGLRKTVTGSDAHAWVEYWDGQRWQLLEVTPTVEASTVPEMAENKEGNTAGILWVLPSLAIFALLLLSRLRRRDDSRIKELRQKATFSRDGLTAAEKAEYSALIKAREPPRKRAIPELPLR